jgi:catechol 2,3-dioxygenase-like lactoylglutathione lyase family enzyme
MEPMLPVHATPKLRLGDTEVARIGLGTNRLTNTPEHVAFVKEAVDAGVNLIDTAHASAQELAPAANRPGLRHVAFKVDDVRGIVDRVREAGWETVGEIVDFEKTFLLCYVRGPEGLIVELAERLDGAPG